MMMRPAACSDQFHLYATPVRLQFKTDENPYQPNNQRNTKSLMEHLKEKRERRINKGKAARGGTSKNWI